MNFAFLTSIAWFFTNSEKPAETVIGKFISGGIYIIQNENDGHILVANWTKIDGQPANVITDRWKVSTKGTWLLTANPYPRNDTYILRPTNAIMNQVTNAAENGVLRNDYYNFWKLQYAGRSFGAEKWLIIHAGSTVDPNPNTPGQNMCLENQKRLEPVLHRPCDKSIHKQRWKFCVFQHPD